MKHKHTVFNDFTWGSVGAVSTSQYLFPAVTCLHAVSVWLTVGLYAADVLNCYFKCNSEIKRLKEIKKSLESSSESQKSPAQRRKLVRRIDEKIHLLKYDRKRKLAIVTVLFLGMAGAAVSIVCPIVPLAGLVIGIASKSALVLTCLYGFCHKQKLKSKQSASKAKLKR